MTRYIVLLAMAAVISGCASLGTESPRAAVDLEKVARIESAARTVGVSVYWVNYPTRASASLN